MPRYRPRPTEVAPVAVAVAVNAHDNDNADEAGGSAPAMWAAIVLRSVSAQGRVDLAEDFFE